jgi:GNAT superfamily N-acetyltransferase
MKLNRQKINIRKAGGNEFLEILQLLKIATENLQYRGIDQWSYWLDPPKERLDWAGDGFHNEEFFFITLNSQIIGMYRLCKEDLLYWGKQNDAAYYIHSFVIHPKYKGFQLGRYTLQFITEEALKNKISILRLDCNASNKALCQYYLNQGFIKVGEKQMPLSLNSLFEKSLEK